MESKTQQKKTVITTKYPIEVPGNILSSAAVYRVWFGKHYLIWKGKYLLQSAENLAESIERHLRTSVDDETSWLYHVGRHIKKTRCISAKIDVIDSDFIKEGTTTAIDVYRMLRVEQSLLNEASGDAKCLNNNQQAYIPKWMEKSDFGAVQKFLRNWDKM